MEREQIKIASPEQTFAANRFAFYYSRARIDVPDIAKREFGVGGWEKKIEARHMAFKTSEELAGYLARNAPFYISHSAAYYEFPDGKPMERKNWLGADLIFDLDANALKIQCAHKGKWVCEKCLSGVKQETVRLIEEFLIPDFGFSRHEIHVNFSGNRGYHIHIRNKAVSSLDGAARKEIASYITGTGLSFSAIGFRKTEKKMLGPKPSDAGWAGRIAKGVVRLLESGENAGAQKSVKRLIANKDKVIAGIERGNWDVVRLPENKEAFWSSLTAGMAVSLGDAIDQGVTTDTSKLIRLPDSLHGESALIAKRVRSIENFDPMKESIAFGDSEIEVLVKEAPAMRLKDRVFGPYKNEKALLPEYAALYLICKKEATLWK